ncbi:hypothetical protein KAS08_00215 [Candidatus Pacearchaeota archaeon]|nr:hypothetical protein [Candidatus Pacearchaeota archaeon]
MKKDEIKALLKIFFTSVVLVVILGTILQVVGATGMIDDSTVLIIVGNILPIITICLLFITALIVATLIFLIL